MSNDERWYRNGELTDAGLHDIDPHTGQVRLKITTDLGTTKWLSITVVEALAIADLLTRTTTED